MLNSFFHNDEVALNFISTFETKFDSLPSKKGGKHYEESLLTTLLYRLLQQGDTAKYFMFATNPNRDQFLYDERMAMIRDTIIWLANQK